MLHIFKSKLGKTKGRYGQNISENKTDENGTTTQELNDTFKRELFEKYGQKHTI